MAQPRILSVGCDSRLLTARHKLLERAGFDVTSLGSTYEALKVLERESFDAVVVGYAFSFTEKQLFAAEVGERWRMPVIVQHEADFQKAANAELEITESAFELVGNIWSILQRRQKQSA